MIDHITKAWQFIFNNHPKGDEIMTAIIETPEIVTVRRFEIWFNEARATL